MARSHTGHTAAVIWLHAAETHTCFWPACGTCSQAGSVPAACAAAGDRSAVRAGPGIPKHGDSEPAPDAAWLLLSSARLHTQAHRRYIF